MATAINSTAIRITWNEPETTNGVITGYGITYSFSNDILIGNVTVNGTQRAVIIGGLDPFTTYNVSVFATTVVDGAAATDSVQTDEAGIYNLF